MSQVPVIVLVLAVFALVVFATTRKIHLGLAAAAGGVAFALLRGLSLRQTLGAAAGELFDPDTLLLVLLVMCIMAFSAAMKKGGALAEFQAAVSALAPEPRAAMIAAPLLIGTLPMPGGAILSAPLVDSLDPERRYGAEALSTANYWFRHGLELLWPLYPAFILAAGMTGFGMGKQALLNWYALPAVIALGWFFVLRPAKGGKHPDATPRPPAGERLRVIARGLAPLAAVLGAYIVLALAIGALAPALALEGQAKALVSRYVPIFSGLALGALLLRVRAKSWKPFAGSFNPHTLSLAFVIAGILVFSALLEAGDAAAASAAELAAAGIHPLVACAVLPLVAGLVTGVGFGYVGLAYPIVLGLFPQGGEFPREAAVVIAGAFGWAGMMLSPLHVCMVVTAEHFGTGLFAMIRRFALPLAAYLTVAMAYAAVLAKAMGQ